MRAGGTSPPVPGRGGASLKTRAGSFLSPGTCSRPFVFSSVPFPTPPPHPCCSWCPSGGQQAPSRSTVGDPESRERQHGSCLSRLRPSPGSAFPSFLSPSFLLLPSPPSSLPTPAAFPCRARAPDGDPSTLLTFSHCRKDISAAAAPWLARPRRPASAACWETGAWALLLGIPQLGTPCVSSLSGPPAPVN